MQIIPLEAVPAQSLRVKLAGQNCTIRVYQKTTGVYFDLDVEQINLVSGVLCRDRVKLVRYEYLGLTGDFSFMDTQGKSDPEYSGFGGRFDLVYLEGDEAS